MDGVVAEAEGLLFPGVGALRVSGPASICMWVVRMAQIKGAAPVGGQRHLIHWDRQSMTSPR